MSEQEMLENEANDAAAEEPVVEELAAEEPAIEETSEEDGLPTRDAEDHLPTKPGWNVILSGLFYAAFCLLLLGIVIAALSGPGITGFGWFIIIVFAVGAFAAGYSAYDELRHLKNAMALDKNCKLESVTILDNWADQYEDGGIATRKDHFHIIYTYAEGKQYAKHSIKKSDAPALKAGIKIQVQYLEEDPTVYRPLFSE